MTHEQDTSEKINNETTKYVKFTYVGEETKFLTKLLNNIQTPQLSI
jgi:hypothetical protein